jgi:hypothetical protein
MKYMSKTLMISLTGRQFNETPIKNGFARRFGGICVC